MDAGAMRAGAMLRLAGAAAAAVLVSCNATIDNNSNTQVTDSSPVGVWSGKDSVTGLGLTAYINSAGQATFIRSDGVQFDGPVQVSGTTLAVTLSGYSDFGANFSDGSNYGIGTLNGAVMSGNTLTGTLVFTTNGNTALNGTWSLSFEPQSDDASSPSAVSGNYTDNVTGTVLSINTNGVMTSQNAANGCVLNGTISTADTRHDVYEVAFQYGNCTGTYAVLNGVQFTGLASLNPGTSPQQLSWAVAGASGSNRYGIVTTYSGS